MAAHWTGNERQEPQTPKADGPFWFRLLVACAVVWLFVWAFLGETPVSG